MVTAYAPSAAAPISSTARTELLSTIHAREPDGDVELARLGQQASPPQNAGEQRRPR